MEKWLCSDGVGCPTPSERKRSVLELPLLNRAFQICPRHVLELLGLKRTGICSNNEGRFPAGWRAISSSKYDHLCMIVNSGCESGWRPVAKVGLNTSDQLLNTLLLEDTKRRYRSLEEGENTSWSGLSPTLQNTAYGLWRNRVLYSVRAKPLFCWNKAF